MAQMRLQDALNENVQFISRALHQIEAGNAPETELHNVGVYLVTTLELIEADPTITKAADELSRLAAECVSEQGREVLAQKEPHVQPDHVRAMNDAFSRFPDALTVARPSQQSLDEPLHRADPVRRE